MTYNPFEPLEPLAWLAIDEDERVRIVQEFIAGLGMEIEDAVGLGVYVTIVENQIAMGDETPAKAAIDRLEMEGLDRFTALLAVQDTFADYLEDMEDGELEYDTEEYRKRLSRIDKNEWKEGI